MSNQTLLNETTIRRFMKLAEIEPLAASFINETHDSTKEGPYGAAMVDDDEPALEGDEDLGVEFEDEEPAEAGLEADEDLGVELEDEAEVEGEGDEDLGELTLTDEEAEVFLKVADKVRAAMEGAPPPEEVPEPDLGEPELEEPGLEEPGLEPEAEEEELVQEIARRVAKRLLTKKNK